ncbi:MAG: hypothetical protein R2940_12750 [Syntrophotaleaceae bacterium]
MLRKISCGYAAGTVGALVAAGVLWLLVREGVTAWMGISWHPRMSRDWLVVRLFWGGIFGLPLALPILENRVILRGLVAAAVPAAYTLMVLFSRAGLGYGALTPVLIGSIFALWGICAAGWYRQSR